MNPAPKDGGPNLVCTFGLEEGRALPQKTKPIADALRFAWALLFAADARVDSVPLRSHPSIRWPAALGASWPPLPVFSFLPTADVDVGWWPPGRAAFGCPNNIARRVHDKAFAIRSAHKLSADSTGQFPPGLCSVLEPADCVPDMVAAKIDAWPTWAKKSWTLKPRLGTSGRGRVRGDLGGPHSPRVVGGLRRFQETDGAILEPWCQRVDDYSAHAFVAQDGSVQCLGTLRQWTTTPGVCIGLEGQWRNSRAPNVRTTTHATDDEMNNIVEDLERVATGIGRLAADEGYCGLIGVDAFTYRDPPSGRVHLRPVVEVNARFTMGSIALGIAKRAADAGVLHDGDTFSLSLTQQALEDADSVFVLGATVDRGVPTTTTKTPVIPGLTLSVRNGPTAPQARR